MHHASKSLRRSFVSLVPLTCGQCCDTIPPGSTFTRHGTRANRYAYLPACWHCQPFDLIAPHKQGRSA